MDTSNVIQLVVLIFLVLLSAFFSSAETAFSTVNHIRLRNLEEEGNKKAATANKILAKYSKMLSAILIGNNIVNISASSLATTMVIDVWGNVYVGVATGILTIVVLICGEILPKTWANLYADKIALVYAPIVYFLMKILTPVIFLIDIIAKGIMKLLHIDPSKKTDTITESELKTYVDVSHEDGEIESEEREMIYNVFDLSDTSAKDIMIPRTHMVIINSDATIKDLQDVFIDSMYTRIPVYDEDKDSMLGFINIKDFFLAEIKMDPTVSIQSLIREAYFTYEYKKTADLLLEMREKAVNVAFVLNEYGSTVGMITLEDLLEELVGEIRDEYDGDEEKLIQKLAERTYLIAGSMHISDINDALDTKLNSEDYDSIGGIIIDQLGRLPEDEEAVTLSDGTTLQVKGLDQNRIVQVLLTMPEPNDTEKSDTEVQE